MSDPAPPTSGRLARSDRLRIRLSRGTGSGPTRLAAFDAALQAAGVADFNLIRLSSVIPPGALVCEVEAADQLRGRHGDRLYCVYADAYASSPGEQAWAGVAWSIRDSDGGGLLVEHHGSSAGVLEHDLAASLADLDRRRGGEFTPRGSVTAYAECAEQPVCALVVASFVARGWEEPLQA